MTAIPGGMRLEVERQGDAVHLVFHCRDAYAAMLLFDAVQAQAAGGGFDLTWTSRGDSLEHRTP